jgi:hypothetical protein
VKMSPNSKYILISSLDSTITLWDQKNAKNVATFKGINLRDNHKNLGHANENLLLPVFFHLDTEKKDELLVTIMDEENNLKFWEVSQKMPIKEIQIQLEDRSKNSLIEK